MKKMLLILIASIVFFDVNVYATEYYSEFHVDTVFYDEISPDSFDSMYVYMIDDKGISYEIPLSGSNGFSYSGNISYNNTLSFNYGMIAGDNTGKYEIIGTLNNLNSRFNLTVYVYNKEVEEKNPLSNVNDENIDNKHEEVKTTLPTVDNNLEQSTSSLVVKEDKDNTPVYKLYFIVGVVLGILVLLFVVKGLIKISNANK